MQCHETSFPTQEIHKLSFFTHGVLTCIPASQKDKLKSWKSQFSITGLLLTSRPHRVEYNPALSQWHKHHYQVCWRREYFSKWLWLLFGGRATPLECAASNYTATSDDKPIGEANSQSQCCHTHRFTVGYLFCSSASNIKKKTQLTHQEAWCQCLLLSVIFMLIRTAMCVRLPLLQYCYKTMRLLCSKFLFCFCLLLIMVKRDCKMYN